MTPPGEFVRCSSCGRPALLRQDGTLGLHFSVDTKHVRRRCPNAGQRQAGRSTADPRPRPRQRVRLVLDVVLPDGWSVGEYRAAADRLLRSEIPDSFLVSTRVDDQPTREDGAA